MPWIVYETTNLKNGKKYVGVHKQDGDGFDGYLGSGTALNAAIRKYGYAFFLRRTLGVFQSEQEAYSREAEIVTEEWCGRRDTYNQKPGGIGGFPWESDEFRSKQSTASSRHMRSLNSDPSFRARMAERNAEPEFAAKKSADASRLARALYENDEFRAKQAAAASSHMRSLHADPEFKKRQAAASSSRMKARMADPALKKQHSETMKALWASPEYRAMMKAKRSKCQ